MTTFEKAILATTLLAFAATPAAAQGVYEDKKEAGGGRYNWFTVARTTIDLEGRGEGQAIGGLLRLAWANPLISPFVSAGGSFVTIGDAAPRDYGVFDLQLGLELGYRLPLSVAIRPYLSAAGGVTSAMSSAEQTTASESELLYGFGLGLTGGIQVFPTRRLGLEIGISRLSGNLKDSATTTANPFAGTGSINRLYASIGFHKGAGSSAVRR